MLDAALTSFHFLRPQALWALVPFVLLYLLWQFRQDSDRQLRRIIAPHLLEELVVGRGRRFRLGPIHLTTLTGVVATLAVAGPSWEREVSPFSEDTAPLVIVLDASVEMNAIDVRPTRLERAKHKVRDLLSRRPGARTALIAYAGSAHTVLPLSDDPTMFEAFLDGLDTSVMPVDGDAPLEALALADSILARDSVPGSILFITDGIAAESAGSFAAHQAASEDRVMALAIGTEEGGPISTGANRFATDAGGRRIVATLDRAGFEALRDEADVFVVGATVDEADVDRLQSRVQSNLRVAQQADETARWKDAGYYLVYPLLLLALFWFRKGWTVRWSAGLLLLGLAGCSPDGDPRWVGLWLTPDQQGRLLAEEGRWSEASERFDDLMWRGTAAYRADDMEGAIFAWARVDAPEAHYGLGNAYARLGQYETSVASYDEALEMRPGWTDAEENRALVLSLIPPPPEPGEEAPPGPPNMDADDVTFDEKGEEGERGEVDRQLLDDADITDMWLRRLQTSPGDFLRRRFAIERAQRGDDPSGGGGA